MGRPMIPAADDTDLSPVTPLSDLVLKQKDTSHLGHATLDGKPVWPETRKRELLFPKDLGAPGDARQGGVSKGRACTLRYVRLTGSQAERIPVLSRREGGRGENLPPPPAARPTP